jgi:hypothetical protein
MYGVYTPPTVEDIRLRWQQICTWAKQNGRCQRYQKDVELDCESGWIYFVHRGMVRLQGQPRTSSVGTSIAIEVPKDVAPSLLALVGVGQPFELGREQYLQATSHVHNTEVIRIHVSELSFVPGFEIDVLQAFRYQHQRQMRQLNNVTQGRVIDQLLGYLYLLAEEFGKADSKGLHLPFVLTHSQLAGAIGSTRGTVTRLLGELRKNGEIKIAGDNTISLPLRKKSPLHLQLLE